MYAANLSHAERAVLEGATMASMPEKDRGLHLHAIPEATPHSPPQPNANTPFHRCHLNAAYRTCEMRHRRPC